MDMEKEQASGNEEQPGKGKGLSPLPTPLNPEERYRLKALLGRGGMATVHKAFDRSLRRNVALKALRADRAREEGDLLHRFLEEAQVTAQIQHPGIVSLYDLGMFGDGRPFFTMNLVSGLTLEEILDEAKRPGSEWTRSRLLHVFLKVCETLAFAHARQVVHRDLKPLNIMVGEYGEVTVMDWGISKILGASAGRVEREGKKKDDETQGPEVRTVRSETARATRYGEMVGTPHYMSPEQAQGRTDEVDERSDIYSLGVILYEFLTGTLPFEEEDYLTFRYAHAEPLPPHEADPTVPPELSRICMRCLAPERERRYASVRALIREIHLFLDRDAGFERRTVPAGKVILRKGEEAREAYLILRGRAEVYETKEGKKVAYAVLKKGDTFGEIALFTGAPRNADVRAVTDLEVVVFDREKVRRELNKVQHWMGDMIGNLAEKLARLNEKYADVQIRGRGEE